MIPID